MIPVGDVLVLFLHKEVSKSSRWSMLVENMQITTVKTRMYGQSQGLDFNNIGIDLGPLLGEIWEGVGAETVVPALVNNATIGSGVGGGNHSRNGCSWWKVPKI